MIVTCPSCTARWHVADEDIPPMGRMVKCASCAHTWFEAGALTLAQPVDSDSPQTGLAPGAPGGLKRADIERMRLAAAKENATQAVRARAHERQKKAQARAAAFAWGGVGLAFAGVLAAAAVFRVDLVRIWPQSSSAFASVGLGVNPFGLELREVTVQRTFDGVIPVVSAGGLIANPSSMTRETPKLHVTLRDAAGNEVLSWVAEPPAPALAPGDSVPFQVAINAPPATAVALEVAFAPVGSQVSAPPAPPPAPQPAPAPAEALAWSPDGTDTAEPEGGTDGPYDALASESADGSDPGHDGGAPG